MEGLQEKRKKDNVLKKTWERYTSFGHGQIQKASPTSPPLIASSGRPMVKSKSWSTFCPSSPLSPRLEKRVGGSKNSRLGSLSPKGCLSVYVGPDRQRFVVKIEYTNHPLFKMLLEKAEMEYGFNVDGPLTLPCEVDVFIKILYEMEAKDDDDNNNNSSRCKFSRSRSSYHLLNSSSRLVA